MNELPTLPCITQLFASLDPVSSKNMLPQVAHHPRQLSQQFDSSAFATPPFESIPNPRRPERLAPLPFRYPRPHEGSSTSLAPLYRAFPVESHDVRRPGYFHGRSGSQGLGGQYHDSSEHMLRRKTPNGTLGVYNMPLYFEY